MDVVVAETQSGVSTNPALHAQAVGTRARRASTRATAAGRVRHDREDRAVRRRRPFFSVEGLLIEGSVTVLMFMMWFTSRDRLERLDASVAPPPSSSMVTAGFFFPHFFRTSAFSANVVRFSSIFLRQKM